MVNSIDEIKNDLQSIVKDLKTKLEYEKSFGVEGFYTNPLFVVEEKAIAKETEIETEKETEKEIEIEKDKYQLLAELKDKTLQCELCQLSGTRTNVVFGAGDPDAALMFVGEAPGYYEDQKGEPFADKAGELLTKIINAIDMERKDVFITNILKCMPPENRTPDANEIASCLPYLEEQIRIIRPKVICALGTFTAQTLLKSTESIENLRNRFHDYDGIKLMATYHPGHLLINTNDKRKTWEDMKKVRDYLKSIIAD